MKGDSNKGKALVPMKFMLYNENYIWMLFGRAVPMCGKIQRICIVILVFLSLLIYSGCALFPNEETMLAPPLVKPEEITYDTEEVRVDDIERSLQFSGYFVPIVKDDYFFTSQSGRLKDIYFYTGDTVSKGDLLAELQTESIEDQLMQQELLVDTKESDLIRTKEIQAIDIEILENKKKALEEEFKLLQSNPNMYSKATITELENQKLLLKKQTIQYKIQIKTKENDLQLARLRLAQLRKQLENSRIYALRDGVVTYVANLDEGDMVSLYSTIISIADPNQLQLEYKGAQSRELSLGMKVEVTVKENNYEGEVVLTASSVPYEEREAYYNTVRINVLNSGSEIEKGVMGFVKVVMEKSEDTLIVPNSAVRFYRGDNLVYVLEGGIRKEKYVKLGVSSGTEVEILEGLGAGEKVIVD